jgi:hypothetical protein
MITLTYISLIIKETFERVSNTFAKQNLLLRFMRTICDYLKRVWTTMCLLVLHLHIVGFLLYSSYAYAQVRQEFWSKVTVSKKVNQRWTVGGDVQYRSQANYYTSNIQRFQNDLLQSIRTTLQYKMSPKYRVDILVSPLIYFRSFDIDKRGHTTPQNELRVALGAVHQQTFWKRTKLRNRLLYEMRFLKFDKPEHIVQHRYRWQLQMTIPIFRIHSDYDINYVVFDEVFVAHQESKTFFEQNRLYNALQLRYKYSEFNIGFQQSIQNIKEELIKRNQLHLSLNFSID